MTPGELNDSLIDMETPTEIRSIVRVLVSGQELRDDLRLGQFLARFGAASYQRSDSYLELLTALESQEFDIIITDLAFDQIDLPLLLQTLNGRPEPQTLLVCRRSESSCVDLTEGDSLNTIDWPAEYQEFALHLFNALPAAQQEKLALIAQLLRGEPVERRFSLTSRELSMGRTHFELADALRGAGLIDQNTALRLELVFQEAVANAHEHGNLELASRWREEIDPIGLDRFSQEKLARLKNPMFADRQVEIAYSFQEQTITIEIRDQGPGFLSDSAAEEVDSQESVKVHGRGLSIIHSVMDSVEYRDRGTFLTIRKKIVTSADS